MKIQKRNALAFLYFSAFWHIYIRVNKLINSNLVNHITQIINF